MYFSRSLMFQPKVFFLFPKTPYSFTPQVKMYFHSTEAMFPRISFRWSFFLLIFQAVLHCHLFIETFLDHFEYSVSFTNYFALFITLLLLEIIAFMYLLVYHTSIPLEQHKLPESRGLFCLAYHCYSRVRLSPP